MQAAPIRHRIARPTGRRAGAGRAATSLLAVLALVAGLVTVGAVTAPPAQASVRQSFDAAYSDQQNGAIVLIGNSQLTCNAAVAGCINARAGAGSDTNNNSWNMGFIDADSSTATTNSTTANLAMPDGSYVLYAMLVWGGRTTAGTGGSASSGEQQSVLFATPTTGYTKVSTTDGSGNVYYQGAAVDTRPYQSSIDVTAAVRAAGNGTYSVGNIAAGTGEDRYAGWSLVVAYRNPAAPVRDLRIYRGFADVTSAAGNSSVSIPISGFRTPAVGAVNASIGMVTWEGDQASTGDAAAFNGKALADPTHPGTNFFDSRISDAGQPITTRNANYLNTFGVDILRTNAADYLSNAQTSTTVEVKTGGETFYPGIISTQIDLYSPAFNPTVKTVTNLSGHDPAQPGDTLRYQLSYTNTGFDYADNPVLRDALPANISYVPGSLRVITNTGGTTGPLTDAADSDAGEYNAASRTVVARPGSGTPRNLAPNAQNVTQFDATVDRAAAGTTIANTSTLAYRARTLDKDYTYSSNATSTPVTALADLAITKTSSATTQTAGSPVDYTLTATNNGPNAAVNPVITDSLPDGVSFTGADTPAGWSCTAAGSTITCSATSLANGANARIVLHTTVGSGSAAGSLTNSASVGSDTGDDVRTNNVSTASTAITRSADVTVTKTASAASVIAGRSIQYTVTIANNGPSTAEQAAVSDVVPAGFTFTGTVTGCTITDRRADCSVGTLAPGASRSFTLTAAVASTADAGTYTDVATASTTTPESSTGNNSVSLATDVTRQADLTISKRATTSPVPAAGVAEWTITATNAGPSDANQVVVTDPFPAGLARIRSATSTIGTCTVAAGGDISCPIGSLGAGATATITVRADVLGDGVTSVTNRATIRSDDPRQSDPTVANNVADSTIAVTPQADLSLTKVANGTTVNWGTPFTYTFTAANAGPSTAAAAVVSDTLPTGMTFASSNPAGTCNAPTGQPVTCALGDLAPNTQRQFTITVNTDPSGSGDATNTATIGSNTADPTPTDNTARSVANGQQQADLRLAKTTETSPIPESGGTIRYTVAVDNLGPSTAGGATVSDTLPAGITNPVITAPAGVTCTTTANSWSCRLNSMAVNATRTITIAATVGDNTRGSSTNTASLSNPATADPNPANDSDSSTETIRPVSDVYAQITAPAGPVTAGQNATWTIVAGNLGPATAIGNTLITIPEDPALQITSITIAGQPADCTGFGSGTIRCALGDLAKGAAVTLSVNTTVNSSATAGPIGLNASIGSQTLDRNLANNSASANVTVVQRADLAIDKVSTAALLVGTQATYTITVTNNGPSDAVNTVTSDTLDPRLQLVSASGTRSTCNVRPTNAQSFDCSVARLLPGRTDVITVTVNVLPAAAGAASIDNTASTTSDTPGTHPADTDTTAVRTAAALRVVKTADPGTVNAGQTITYTLSVTNTGPSPAQNTTLSDPLADGLTVLPNSTQVAGGGTCTPNSGTPNPNTRQLECAFGTLPSGASRVVSFQALVDQTHAAGNLTNTATVASPTPDTSSDPADRTDSASTAISTSADLTITKLPVQQPPQAGTNQDYLITATNGGPSMARQVVVTDTLPAGVTYIDATSTVGTCAAAGVTVTCTAPSLASGAAMVIQLRVKLSPSIQGSRLVNTASVDADTDDPNTTNNSSTIDQPVSSQVSLALTKTLNDPGTLIAGDTATYTMVVTNNGPSDANAVTIGDPTPAGTTTTTMTASDGGSCLPAVPAGVETIALPQRCTWAMVPLGASRTMTVTVKIDPDLAAGTAITNVATATSNNPNPDGPAVARVSGASTRQADLQVTKTLLSPSARAGEPVRWRISVRNAGPTPAVNTQVSDPAAPGVTFTGADPSQGTCDDLDPLHCAVGTIAAGATVDVIVTGTLAAGLSGDSVSNSAQATSDTPDRTPGDNTGSVTSPLSTSADLVLGKSVSPGAVQAGGSVRWTLTLDNLGPSSATGTELTDSLPAGISAVTATSSDGTTCTLTTSEVRCPLGTVAPGRVSVTINAVVAGGYTATTLRNSASVVSGTPDPKPSNNDADVTATVTRAADLTITKSAPANAVAGRTINWTATVRNNGPSDAQSVQLADPLPAHLVNPSARTSDNTACTIGAGSANGTVTCPLGSIRAADTKTVTITATIAPDFTGTLANTASVSSQTPDPVDNNTSAPVQTTVTALADLAVSKHATTDLVAGSAGTWVIDLRNSGPSTATGATITDTFPDGVTPRSGTLPDGTACTVAGQVLTCAMGTVSSGTAVRITVTGQISPDATGNTITNTATATSDTADTNQANNTGGDPAPLTHSADVYIGKDLADSSPVAGERATYQITAGNRGPSAAQNVTVDDQLPAAFAAATTNTAGCSVTAGVLKCAFGTLAPGQTRVITLATTLPADFTGELANAATVATTTDDPRGPNSATSRAKVATSADVAVTKSGPSGVTAGEQASWQITVTNRGPSVATAISVRDTPDPAVTDVRLAIGGTTCANPCVLDSLAVGDSVTITATGTVAADTTAAEVRNAVQVSTASPDPVSSNNVAVSAPAPVGRSADLSIVKSVNPRVLVPGTAGKYTLTVANAGPSDADDPIVTDQLPDGLIVDPATVGVVSDGDGAPTCTVTDRTLSCQLRDLGDGDTAVITVPFQVPSTLGAGQLANTATASDSVGDPSPANNSATATAPVVPQADLTLAKTGPDRAVAGAPISWTVTLNNAGPSAAPDTVITDQIPAGVSAVTATPTQGSCAVTDGTVTCTVGTVAVGGGGQVRIVIDGTLAPTYTGDAVQNSATVASGAAEPTTVPSGDPTAGGRASTVSTPVARQVDLELTKTADLAAVQAGSRITWTLTAVNNGPSTARSVTVSDTLPVGLSDVQPGAGLTCTADTCTARRRTGARRRPHLHSVGCRRRCGAGE